MEDRDSIAHGEPDSSIPPNDYESEIMEVHETPVLSDLAELGDTDAVKQLIEGGAKVNAKDSFDRPVLSRAIERGQTDIARLLIECGALKMLENSVAQGKKDQPYLAQTTSQDGSIKLENTTVSGCMIDITTTDTGRRI
jgi:hypothetical protein